MIDSVFDRPHLAGGRAPQRAEPPEVATDAAVAVWSPLRAPPKDQDKVLLSPTHFWLRRIPTRFHPKHLCRYYPRLANRLAQCWGKKDRLEQFMDDLLVDHRGGRKGLSDRVVMELQRLERFHSARPGPGRQGASGRVRLRWPDEGRGSNR